MWRAVGIIKQAYPIVCLDKFLSGYRILIQKRFCKGQYDMFYLSFRDKSTDTGNEKYERQMRIIEKCFAPKDGVQNNNENSDTPADNENIQCVSESVEKDGTNKYNNKILDDVKLQATTAKQPEEELAQKLEKIDEIPLVEAGTSNVGFNEQPKVLGGQESYDFYDELASRCLNVPVNEIDKYLLWEIKIIARSIKSQVDFPEDFQLTADKYITRVMKTELLQMPKIISPYDRHSYPFYEYTNREVVEEEEWDSDPIIETVDESTLDKAQTPGLNKVLVPGSSLGVQVLKLDGPQIFKESQFIHANLIITSSDDPSQRFPHVQGIFYYKGEENPHPNTVMIGTLQKQESNKTPVQLKDTTISKNQLIAEPNTNITKDQREPRNDRPVLDISTKIHMAKEAINTEGTSAKTHMTKETINSDDISAKIHMANETINSDDISAKIHMAKETINSDDISAKTHMAKETINSDGISAKIHMAKETINSDDISAKTHMAKETINSDIKRDNHATSNILYKTDVDLNKFVSEFTSNKTIVSKTPETKTENVPLSELLKIVRRRARTETHDDSVLKSINLSCPPPSLKCPPSKPPPKCPPDPPKCPPDPPKCPPPPNPPKCPPDPPKCPPDPPKCPPDPPKCPPDPPKCPPKKDPCAKFISVFNNRIIIFSTGIKILNFPIFNIERYLSKQIIITKEVLEVIKSSVRNLDCKYIDNHEGIEHFARDFQPWSPIPSWPTLKKEQKRPVVCPKDGCKLLPPTPCKEKTCSGFPKKTLYKTMIGF